MATPSEYPTSPKRSKTLFETIDPTDRQKEFFRAIESHDYVLYGGAMGGGKSYILRWWLVYYLKWLYEKHHLRNVMVGLFCESYPALADRQIAKIKYEFPRELGNLSMDSRTGVNFQLNPEHGGGIIALRNLDDPAKYVSAEFAGIAIDELTKNDKKVFDFLRTRKRWKGIVHTKFAAATNPGGLGHAWVKKLWIDRDFPSELVPLADQFAFVQAKASDNLAHLTQTYWDELQTLPDDMRKPFLEGSWDIFAGQYFDIWAEEKMTVSSQHLELKPWWPRWVSIDWGFVHPAAVYWHAKDDDRVITYRELCKASVGESDLGLRIAEMSKGENIKHIFLSPDAFAKRGNQNTVAEQIGDALAANGLPRPTPADNDRIGGARLCYQMLHSGLAFISNACPALIRCLPTLVRDEDNLEDVLKVDGDDPYDAWRYGLKTMLGAKEIPVTEQLKERVAEMKQEGVDATNRAILAKKFLQQHAASRKPTGGGRLRWMRKKGYKN